MRSLKPCVVSGSLTYPIVYQELDSPLASFWKINFRLLNIRIC